MWNSWQYQHWWTKYYYYKWTKETEEDQTEVKEKQEKIASGNQKQSGKEVSSTVTWYTDVKYGKHWNAFSILPKIYCLPRTKDEQKSYFYLTLEEEIIIKIGSL